MFITAVCVIFLIKLRWPKTKSLYDTGFLNLKESGNGFCVSLLKDLSGHCGASDEPNWESTLGVYSSVCLRFKNPILDFLKETNPKFLFRPRRNPVRRPGNQMFL